MGIHALEHLIRKQREHGGDVRLTSLQPAVRRMLERAGLVELLGEQHIYWSAVEAIVAAHNDHAANNCPHCRGLKPLTIGVEPQQVTTDHRPPTTDDKALWNTQPPRGYPTRNL
jgi:hypothetical protein